jgi:glucose-1-phosphate cytidylyltransferase
MKTVILAGGLGTRIREETEFRPKPMVPIGRHPIIWHIMKTYSFHNFNSFIICTGYRGEVISEYFKNFESVNLDFTIKLGLRESINFHGDLEEKNWEVTVAATGDRTLTGERLLRIQKYVDNETFMCTYGDGVANVDLSELVKFHKAHGKIATVTAVSQPSRFGVLGMDEFNSVHSFNEKPNSSERINGGYFVFEPEIFQYLSPNSTLEREPLMNLAVAGELKAFMHEGFWQPMDTQREMTILNELWESGKAPWKVWQ